jgi:hypothetical protein
MATGEAPPSPVFDRGVWLGGNGYFAVDGLQLHHSFVIEMWVKPRPASSANLFYIGRNLHSHSDHYLALTSTTDSALPTIAFYPAYYTLAGNNELDYVWQHIAFELAYDRGEEATTVILY